MKKSKAYRPPVTISRSEFLTHGSDAEFRLSIYAMVQYIMVRRIQISLPFNLVDTVIIPFFLLLKLLPPC